MRKPFVIFRAPRAGDRTALKCCALLLICAMLLALAVGLFRLQREEQGSMEVFAGEDAAEPRPQGLYALLEQLFGDE